MPFVGVEVSPPYDHAELTSNAAAFFVWTYLCGQISRRKKIIMFHPTTQLTGNNYYAATAPDVQLFQH
ncbi:MAG: hypothetical protein ABIP64_00415 [Burkholderiales bacterium]